jgi:hypothetical protein
MMLPEKRAIKSGCRIPSGTQEDEVASPKRSATALMTNSGELQTFLANLITATQNVRIVRYQPMKRLEAKRQKGECAVSNL